MDYRQLQGTANAPQPTQTLATRLETTENMVSIQCERIEKTLARVNGTPRGEIGAKASGDARCSMSLADSVSALEMHAERLGKLATSLEMIA